MSDFQDLCTLVNEGVAAYINPQEIGDGKLRELYPAIKQESMRSEVAKSVLFFKSADRLEGGHYTMFYRNRMCVPQTGGGTLCDNNTTAFTKPTKTKDTIYLKDFKKWGSTALEVESKGTFYDYCLSYGGDEIYRELSAWFPGAVWEFRMLLEQEIAQALKNNVSPFYPDGSPTSTLKALKLYSTDTTTGTYVVNPTALSVVSGQLKMQGIDTSMTRVAGNVELAILRDALEQMTAYSTTPFYSLMRNSLLSENIAKNPLLNRAPLYFFDPKMFTILTYSDFKEVPTITPVSAESIRQTQIRIMRSDAAEGDNIFTVNIDGESFDLHIKWKKCGNDVQIKFQLLTRYLLHVAPNTDCNDFRVLPYDVCPLEEPTVCPATPEIISEALCLDITPAENCAQAITGAYTFTAGGTTYSGTLEGGSDLQTQSGVNFLFKYLASKHGIANVTQNNGKCGGLIITGINGYAPAVGDTLVFESPCVTITANVIACECVDCEPSEARVSNVAYVYDSNAATFDVTPALALTNDSVVSYAWTLIQGSATLTNTNTAVANLTGVGDGDIELTLVVTTANTVIESRFFYNVKLGAVQKYRTHYITSNATTVSWSTDSNLTDEFDWSVDSSENGLITNGTAAVNAMNGSFAYVKASPDDVLSFRVTGSTICAQAGYNCPAQPFNPLAKKRNVVETAAVEVPAIPTVTTGKKKGANKMS